MKISFLEKIDKPIWWSMLGFVLFSPFSISLTQAAFSFALLFWLIKLFYRPNSWQKTPLDLPIILFLSVGLLSTILGSNPQRSFRELASEIFLFLIFFLVVNNLDYPKIKKLSRLLFVLVTITALYGLIKFFVIHEERLGATKWYMTYGGYIMVAMLFFLPSLLTVGEGVRKRYLCWISFTLMFVALVLTFTRGAWIGFIIGVMFVLFFYGRKWVIGLIISLSLLLVFSFFLFPKSKATHRLRSIGQLNEWGRRPEMWSVALKIIRDNPIFGVGLDNYKFTVPKYLPDENPETTTFGHAHNHYLHITSERGIIGLVTFLFIWYTIFALAYKTYRNTYNVDIRSLTLGVAGAMVGFLTEGLSENIYGDSEIRMLVWFLISVLVVIGKKKAADVQDSQ